MGKRDDLIAKYAQDIETKLGQKPDMDLLRKVTIGCGPSIYSADSETIAGSDKSEVARVRDSFLKKKLGLAESSDLDSAIQTVMDQYGSSNRSKYRAVVYYMLCRHFGKESVYA